VNPAPWATKRSRRPRTVGCRGGDGFEQANELRRKPGVGVTGPRHLPTSIENSFWSSPVDCLIANRAVNQMKEECPRSLG